MYENTAIPDFVDDGKSNGALPRHLTEGNNFIENSDGTNGQILTLDGGVPKWKNPPPSGIKIYKHVVTMENMNVSGDTEGIRVTIYSLASTTITNSSTFNTVKDKAISVNVEVYSSSSIRYCFIVSVYVSSDEFEILGYYINSTNEIGGLYIMATEDTTYSDRVTEL